MADAVNARDSATCGKSFTRVTQEYEEDLDKKGGAETQVDLADDDPEGAEVGDSCSRCGGTLADWPPRVCADSSPSGDHLSKPL